MYLEVRCSVVATNLHLDPCSVVVVRTDRGCQGLASLYCDLSMLQSSQSGDKEREERLRKVRELQRRAQMEKRRIAEQVGTPLQSCSNLLREL